MRKWAIRILFLAAIAMVPGQEVLRRAVGEPYPALFLPSFSGVRERDGIVRTQEPVVTIVYAGGRRRRTRFDTLLPRTAVLPQAVFRSAFFSDRRASDPRTRDWLRTSLRAQGRGAAEGVVVSWHEVFYDTATRSRRLGRTVREVRVDLSP
jgi:hypothetical protein